jgi:hypothetical protein
MSKRIEKSVIINAPKEFVWDLLQDINRRLDWDARVTLARILSAGPVKRGSRIQINTRMYGITFPAIMEFISWNPPYRSAVKSVETDRGIESVVGSWKLEENDKGETIWTTTIVITPEPGLYGRLLSAVLSSSFEKLTVQSQKNFKALVEREYSQPSVAVEREVVMA